MISPNFGLEKYNPFYSEAISAVEDSFIKLNSLANDNHGISSIISLLGVIDVDFVSNGNQYDVVNNVLMIDPSRLNGRTNDSFNADQLGAFGSFTRTVFHELVHAVTVADPSIYQFSLNTNVNFSEAVAIFAENLLYVPAVLGERERAGHSTWEGPSDQTIGTFPKGGGFSGVTAFNWLPGDSEGPQLINVNGTGVTFGASSSNGRYSVSKTYLSGGEFRVEVSGFNADGFLTKSGNSVVLGTGLSAVADTLMGGKSAAIVAAVQAALPTLNSFASLVGDRLGQTSVVGLSGERFYAREHDGFTSDSTTMYDFIGVGLQERDQYQNIIYSYSPPFISVGSAGATEGTIVLGASGSNYSVTSADNLIGGSGNDILISSSRQVGNILNGGGGNDLLLGSTMAGDVINGGAGNDLFIARGLGTTYSGGGDRDILSYYGLTQGIAVSGNSISHHGSIDTFDSIESIIGTTKNDIFLLGGDTAFYGAEGVDTFVGTPTASIDGGLGADILDLRDGSGGVIDGTLLNSIETIYGSGGADILTGNVFRNAQSTATFLGYGGNDIIEQSGSININIDGGAGDDTVIVLGESYGYLRGGTGFDTLDFSQLQANKLVVALSGANGTYTINTGSSHSFSSFEEVNFGSVTLRLQGSGTFTAGTGHNTVFGSNGVDDVTVGGTGGYVRTYGGDDIVHSTGLESVYGELGNDRLFAGDAVGAKLNGGVYPDQAVTWVDDGNDYLQGGAMADTLNGGTGTNELHGGGGYDHFYSGGYGENSVYGDADLGAMHYSFVARGGSPIDPDLVSIEDMGGWFDVVTTSDHGQTYRTDHLYDIDKVYFEGTHFDLEVGFTYYNPDFLI